MCNADGHRVEYFKSALHEFGLPKLSGHTLFIYCKKIMEDKIRETSHDNNSLETTPIQNPKTPFLNLINEEI